MAVVIVIADEIDLQPAIAAIAEMPCAVLRGRER